MNALVSTRPRGRPSGGRGELREKVLEVARAHFMFRGYDGTTLRGVAREAGVDSALLVYYFGSKRGLFGACVELNLSPPEALMDAIDSPFNDLPERLVRAVLDVWERPEQAVSLRALARGVFQEAEVGGLFKEAMEREMVQGLTHRLGGGRSAEGRAATVVSQLVGLVVTRYVLTVEPLASMPSGEVVRIASQGIRVTLAGRSQ